jgi:hypothetical protein
MPERFNYSVRVIKDGIAKVGKYGYET